MRLTRFDQWIGDASLPGSGFETLSGHPGMGEHNPLVLLWSDEQLGPVVERLGPFIPPGLTDRRRLAIAACARSLVVEKLRTGRPLRYYRFKDPYTVPRRYRCGDRLYTWQFVKNGMDDLQRAGLVEQLAGTPGPAGVARQSVAWATDALVDLLGPLVPPGEPRGLTSREDVLVLRDREVKDTLRDFEETFTTRAMRAKVQRVNAALAQLDLRHKGFKVELPLGRRVFNGSFDRGGRFYFHGPSPQNMPTRERRELEVVVGGEAVPMMEADYTSLHITMAYREARRKLPRGDLYYIEGFPRPLVKLAVNVLLNATTRHKGVLAVSEKLWRSRDLRVACRIPPAGRTECRRLADRVVETIHKKHHRIHRHFGSDSGARFQRRDSDMAIQVMLEVTKRTGRCPLPIHDSFLVAETDAQILMEVMWEVARRQGLRPSLKVIRSGHDPALYLPLEVKTPHLQKWVCRLTLKNTSRGGLKLTPDGGNRGYDTACYPGGGLLHGHDPPVALTRPQLVPPRG